MFCRSHVIFFFFFQAEDGIRDVERSRGLGDVYKRQYQRRVHGIEKMSQMTIMKGVMIESEAAIIEFIKFRDPEHRSIIAAIDSTHIFVRTEKVDEIKRQIFELIESNRFREPDSLKKQIYKSTLI
eukprot:TRINITY_DN7997_c0_g1_i4.p1 TRINITY_DN7997_c0_g1~~TRINITY_DN7997_c0_g1_i4.p1  ORF type:complete len:126 (-),score=34.55 TRINITY_DN7997_c0_g1_i4:49-426(-)